MPLVCNVRGVRVVCATAAQIPFNNCNCPFSKNKLVCIIVLCTISTTYNIINSILPY